MISVLIIAVLIGAKITQATPNDELIEEHRTRYDELNDILNTTKAEISKANNNIASIIRSIDNQNAEIEIVKKHICDLNSEIEQITKKINDRQAMLDIRIRESYKENVFVKWFGFFTDGRVSTQDKVDGFTRIVNNDKNIVEELKRDVQLRDAKNEELKVEKEALKSEIEELEKNKKTLDNMIISQTVKMDLLKETISKFDSEYLYLSERELVLYNYNIIDNSENIQELNSSKKQLISIRDFQIKSPNLIDEINTYIHKAEEKISALSSVGGGEYGDTGNDIVDFSYTLIGVPYVWGGTDPNYGLDCSGFTSYVYRKVAGIEITRTTYTQRYQGFSVGYEDLQLGDLVFTYNYEHVGIYVGNGNYINATMPNDIVRVTAINSFCEGRRIN